VYWIFIGYFIDSKVTVPGITLSGLSPRCLWSEQSRPFARVVTSIWKRP